VASVEPEPDTKDWTWTLRRRCPECGLAAGEVKVSELAERTFIAAEEWVVILRSSPAVGARPSPEVWSPLEYGAHVRDVFRRFDRRLTQMLETGVSGASATGTHRGARGVAPPDDSDQPTFENWDQDQTAIEERYAEQDPEEVADELEAAAEEFVRQIRELRPDQLQRRGRRTDGAEFTVVTLLQYFLHDIVHHLWDVTGQQDGVDSLILE
jgi:hypothetical protein